MSKKQTIEERLDALLNKVDGLNQQVSDLQDRVTELEAENQDLREENSALKKRLSRYETPKNSKNSSKPPSSDYPRISRSNSLRKRSGKKPGGQTGRSGTTLQMVSCPDIINDHHANYCTCCGEDLSVIEGEYAGKRQVIDIPPIKPIVTEHRIYTRQCRCGQVPAVIPRKSMPQ